MFSEDFSTIAFPLEKVTKKKVHSDEAMHNKNILMI
jgi:hypothetical protein